MRIGLIEQVQEMIEAGTYDTEERLDVAVDRLLDDLGLTYEQAESTTMSEGNMKLNVVDPRPARVVPRSPAASDEQQEAVMDEARLNEIEARAKAATTGPWALMEDGFSRKPPNNCPTVYQTDTDLRYIAFFRDMNEWNQGEPTDNRANAEFCAHARQDIPDLIAEVRRLRAIVAKLPRTADGVPVVPGMEVWASWHLPGPLGVVRGFSLHDDGRLSCLYFKGGGFTTRSGGDAIYSTREAAEAAKDGAA